MLASTTWRARPGEHDLASTTWRARPGGMGMGRGRMRVWGGRFGRRPARFLNESRGRARRIGRYAGRGGAGPPILLVGVDIVRRVWYYARAGVYSGRQKGRGRSGQAGQRDTSEESHTLGRDANRRRALYVAAAWAGRGTTVGLHGTVGVSAGAWGGVLLTSGGGGAGEAAVARPELRQVGSRLRGPCSGPWSCYPQG